MGDAGTQYFIKPLEFINDNKESILVDFTFKENIILGDTNFTIMNFSILSNDLVSVFDSIIVKSPSYTNKLTSVKLLYKEKRKKQYFYRVSCKTESKIVENLFTENNWEIIFVSNKQAFNFSATKRTNKAIALLNSAIFEMVNFK
jgi:hypothetical protein